MLFRMSYSSIIRESEDLGAGVFDAQGRELCESDSTPMHIGSLPWYIRGFLDRLEGDISEGDVIVHNHPFLGASHTPDVAVAVPIFAGDELPLITNPDTLALRRPEAAGCHEPNVPAAEKQRGQHRRDRHHVDVFRHEEHRELERRVLRVVPADELRLGGEREAAPDRDRDDEARSRRDEAAVLTMEPLTAIGTTSSLKRPCA